MEFIYIFDFNLIKNRNREIDDIDILHDERLFDNRLKILVQVNWYIYELNNFKCVFEISRAYDLRCFMFE